MIIRAGTSGYSYKEWKGTFYPEDLPASGMLAYYAKHFSTVEINNTFYRMPAAKMLLGWAEQVPDEFAFVLKAPRRITHDKRLKDVDEDMAYLMKAMAALGKKRGPVLFQLPPFFRKDIACLRGFLSLLSRDCPAAMEFRHQSWFDDEVFAVLREHNAALCLADADNELEIPFVSTAAWGYLRLRRPEYSDADLGEWAKRVTSQPWKDAFVFFKHEDAGKGPEFATRFLGLVGK
ncbi:MAG TPA: DUF72 domain-containing protein [Gemmataceae bacterium]|jgi:uncharacterized protein YecE (DUF72 family)|nr:DUF72 domain-containing protein [Gemmataceae bacterium]